MIASAEIEKRDCSLWLDVADLCLRLGKAI